MQSKISFMEYTLKSRETAIYPRAGEDMTYPCLGLKGEIGEVCEHLKKAVRDDDNCITAERESKLFKECGDIAWYLAAILRTLPFNSSIPMLLLRPAATYKAPRDNPKLSDAIKEVNMLAYTTAVLGLKSAEACRKVDYADVMYEGYGYWATLCAALGFNASAVLQANLDKLADRKDRGVLQGSGDDR